MKVGGQLLKVCGGWAVEEALSPMWAAAVWCLKEIIPPRQILIYKTSGLKVVLIQD